MSKTYKHLRMISTMRRRRPYKRQRLYQVDEELI
jgi:hypothetical protein